MTSASIYFTLHGLGLSYNTKKKTTAPPTQLEIPQKATEETHQFEQYHKAAENFGPGQESLNEAESQINSRYPVLSILEEKANDSSHKSPPEMDDPVFNSNKDNGFEYEPDSTLRNHHGCRIVDVEGMYDFEDNKDDPTCHMASLGDQYEDQYNGRFSAPPGLVIDKDIEDINTYTTEFDKNEWQKYREK